MEVWYIGLKIYFPPHSFPPVFSPEIADAAVGSQKSGEVSNINHYYCCCYNYYQLVYTHSATIDIWERSNFRL